MSRYYGMNGGFRQRRQVEDVDPMSSMGNMGDIMLVFACGLMVALVVAWNVDLGKFTQVQMDQTTEVDDVEQITEMLYGEGNAFVEKGTVYQDPTTGKYYLVEEGTSATSATVSSESGEAAPSGTSAGAGSNGGANGSSANGGGSANGGASGTSAGSGGGA